MAKELNIPKEALEKLIEYAVADYNRGGYVRNYGITYEVGRTYVKLIETQGGDHRSVFGFIVNVDGAKYPKGAILKAASWFAPETNFARGSIYNEDTFKNVRWTGIL